MEGKSSGTGRGNGLLPQRIYQLSAWQRLMVIKRGEVANC
jgi:hypothetical protein